MGKKGYVICLKDLENKEGGSTIDISSPSHVLTNLGTKPKLPIGLDRAERWRLAMFPIGSVNEYDFLGLPGASESDEDCGIVLDRERLRECANTCFHTPKNADLETLAWPATSALLLWHNVCSFSTSSSSSE